MKTRERIYETPPRDWSEPPVKRDSCSACGNYLDGPQSSHWDGCRLDPGPVKVAAIIPWSEAMASFFT